jgi:hypothetical protein
MLIVFNEASTRTAIPPRKGHTMVGVYVTGITYAALAAEFGLGTTDTGLPHRRVILNQPCNAYVERVEL